MSETIQATHELQVELYVLGALSQEERRAFTAQLKNDPNLQKQVNDFQAQMLSVSDQLPAEIAPQPLSARIERSIDEYEKLKQHAKNQAVKSASTDFWGAVNFWRGFALAGFFASFLMGVQLFKYATAPAPEPTYVAVLVAPQDKSPGWVIQTSQNDEIQLSPLGAVEIPKGKALQFWTKAEGWDKPISLGLVKEGQPIKVDIDQLPPLEANQLFELTVEDETGSPTGLPTGPIYSIGRGLTL